MEQKPTSKTNLGIIVTIVVIVLLVLGGVIYWQSKKVVPPSSPLPPSPPTVEEKPQIPESQKEDSTDTILKELESLDTGNLDQEFQEIDQDLNSL